MNDIKALAHARRMKEVDVEIEGEAYTFSLIVPVGLEAIEMRQETARLFRRIEELDGLRDSYADRPMDDYEVQLVSEKAEEVERQVIVFAVKWLAKTCSQCIDMREEEVANILRMAGNTNNPLIQALLELAIATNSPSEEGLGDLPF